MDWATSTTASSTTNFDYQFTVGPYWSTSEAAIKPIKKAKAQPMKRSDWQKAYGELRKLLNDPRARSSGRFARVIDQHKNVNICNLKTNRVIAIYNDGSVSLQPNSFYRSVLEAKIERPDKQELSTQPHNIARIGGLLAKKEKICLEN